MSSPMDRLCTDKAAERFEVEARALLACAPLLAPAVETLAAAVLVLVEDRQARQEMAVFAALPKRKEAA